ncbi:hypothetical protein HOC01_02125 [archaeon]|jgi:tyrosine-specific transport protein|nr:hypothetical protein [archaeon]MBT6697884.1 hypothetical protein [archaeon]
MAHPNIHTKHPTRKMLVGAATLSGTVVGAGILGIPYVVSQSGFLIGSAIIILIGLVFLALNLFMGEIVLRTRGFHQLTGYMEKYLGKWGKLGMLFSMTVGIYGALVAYLIGEGQSIKTLVEQIPFLSNIFVGTGLHSTFVYMIGFFIFCGILVWLGMDEVGKAETFVVAIMVLVILIISAVSIPKMNPSYLSNINFGSALAPLGVIIFAFIGSAAIPEVHEIVGKDKKVFKHAIVLGTLAPMILYVLFCAAVIGIVGFSNFEMLSANEKIATIALSYYSHPILGGLANLLAILAMFTSFITLGEALLEAYTYDYKIPRKISFLLVMFVPLLIVLFDLTSFISALAITGAVAGGIDGILIVLAYWKAKVLGDRKPEYSLPLMKGVGYLIMTLFAFGIVHGVWSAIF